MRSNRPTSSGSLMIALIILVQATFVGVAGADEIVPNTYFELSKALQFPNSGKLWRERQQCAQLVGPSCREISNATLKRTARTLD